MILNSENNHLFIKLFSLLELMIHSSFVAKLCLYLHIILRKYMEILRKLLLQGMIMVIEFV